MDNFGVQYLATMFETEAGLFMDEDRQKMLRDRSGIADLQARTTGPFVIINACDSEFCFSTKTPDERILAELAKKQPPPEAKTMAIGASFLANLIRDRQAKVKEQLAQAGQELNAVMDEMEATADAATKQVADAKAEVADLKAALGLNSNGEPA